MNDDTTTWLKKNPGINPLRRSLKTSLRFHVNTSEMNASIMSNPGKAKEQQIILPRLLQRQSLRMKLIQANELKTSGKLPIKSNKTDELTKSTSKNSENFSVSRRSFLPVKNRPQSGQKKEIKNKVVRPSFIPPRGSAKKNFKRELLLKIVETTKNSYVNETNESKMPLETGIPADGSIIRSILKKKRESLRRSLKTSSGKKKTKPVKKVLFEDIENFSEEDKEDNKENDSITFPDSNKSDVLDEPTEFLNFPKFSILSSSPVNRDNLEESTCSITTEKFNSGEKGKDACFMELLKTWNGYMENVKNLQSLRDSLVGSIQVHVEQSQTLQNQFQSYVKNCEELYDELSRLLKVIEGNLRKVFSGCGDKDSPKEVIPSVKRKTRENTDKLGLSDKSKAIKRNSTKTNSALKSGLWNNLTTENGFALVETKGIFNK